MPQISVIVPVYKVEPYLRRCVDSILGQTFADFELILVDDGSPDSCPGICDEYAKEDSRVHVIHQKNGGLSAARNAGIDWAVANSNSQWLTFVDSDDWVHPEYLERLMNAAIAYNTKIVVGGYAETDGEEPLIEASSLLPEEWVVDDFYVQKIVVATIACGKLYHKELFCNIRYPVGRLHEDEFIAYKLLFLFKTVIFIPAPLYFYYQNAAGITKSDWTPQRLDGLDAMEMRISFFRHKQNNKLYEWAINAYLLQSIGTYWRIRALPDKAMSKKCFLSLKRRVRRILIKHRKCWSIKEFADAYEIAYPRLMRLCRMASSVCKKIRAKLAQTKAIH